MHESGRKSSVSHEGALTDSRYEKLQEKKYGKKTGQHK